MTLARIILALLLLAAPAAFCADDPLDTVVVSGKPEEIRREIQTFVTKVTQVDGDLVGRWRKPICPMVVGLSDQQNAFFASRLVEVHDKVRKRAPSNKPCQPNAFVIVTDEAEAVVEAWKREDPGMFRWKTRKGVSRSNGTGAVRTWHNAIVEPGDGDPTSGGVTEPIRSRLKPSRVMSSVSENITAAVVLVDTRAAGPVTLAQIADYVAMVTLSQLDLTADVSGLNSILTLFATPRSPTPPVSLTAWDFAFLNSLYRTSYSPMRQRGDIMARMTRELVPKK